MQATRNLFLRTSSADLDAVEAALLRVDAIEGAAEACQRLAAISDAAHGQGLPRIATIAAAAERLVSRGAPARALALRAIMRLKDVLRATGETEPAGDDSDLLSAAEAERLPSLADTLAQAHARLLEIAPDNRDPRLTALLDRLANLGAGLEEEAEAVSGIEGDIAIEDAPETKPSAPVTLRRAK
ncbi:MAG: hypothetical protein JNJ73_03170 [Hyphomonadaceae bacterium]|nr:hypothetical protein [Hyphomonadaceae bacterium]